MSIPTRYQALLIFTFALFVYAIPLGDRPFFTRGEGREAIVVEEMYQEGDFLLPLDTGPELREVATKPPMFHWIGTLTSLQAGGVSEFSVRFPSALTAALGLAVLFLFVSAQSGPSLGFLSALILAGTFEWNRSAGHARVDMVFSFFVLLSMCGMYRLIESWRANGKISWGWVLVVSVVCAGSALSKGPFGILFPWVVGGSFLLLTLKGSLWSRLKQVPWTGVVVSILGSVVLASCWYLPGYLRGGWDFLYVHLIDENLGRFMDYDGGQDNHIKPFYFSFVYLFTSFLPFSVFFPAFGCWLFWRSAVLRENRQALFSLLSATILFAIVSLSPAKRDVYLLPAFPALAHLFALAFYELQERVKVSRWLRLSLSGPLVIGAVFLAVTGIALYVIVFLQLPVSQAFHRQKTAAQVAAIIDAFAHAPFSFVGAFCAVLCGIAAATLAVRSQFGNALTALSACMISLVSIGNLIILPRLALDGSPRTFVEQMLTIVGKQAPLVQFEQTFFSAMYYADRFMPVSLTAHDIPSAPETYVLVTKGRVDELMSAVDGDSVVLESSNNSANGKEKLVLVRVAVTPQYDATQLKTPLSLAPAVR